MHQVKVEIVHTAVPQLFFKEGADVRLFGKEFAREFVGEDVGGAGMEACKAFLNGPFALSAHIAPGGVEIIEALLQKMIHHFIDFFRIDPAFFHGQAHKAEAQLFLNLRKCRHGFPLLHCFSDASIISKTECPDKKNEGTLFGGEDGGKSRETVVRSSRSVI